jgi:hypothetical protein
MRRLRSELAVDHDIAPSHTSFFYQGSFDQKQLDCCPHPPYFSLFRRLKMKLKDRHFDTVEVIDEGSHAMLNLTEHDLQDAFKMTDALGTVHTS